MLGSSVSLSYGYDLNRGWLNSLTRNGSGFLFNETLTYLSNGNINTQYIGNSNLGYKNLSYSYDNYNRLTSSTNYGSGYENFAYDNDGNIKTKNRPGQTISLSYGTTDNKLTNITVDGFEYIAYGYDAKGNMVTDNRKGITNITYDLPTLKFMLNSFSEGVLR